MATFQSETRIIDLRRSVLDTSEEDALTAKIKQLEDRSLKPPIKPKDEAKLAKYEKELKAHEKKSRDSEVKIFEAKEELKRFKEKEEKDRKKGYYNFKKKVYTDKKMEDSTGGLDFGYRFKWNRDDDRAIRDWEIKYGFELLTSKDPYVVEGAQLDSEGRWIFGDSVMMKITLRKYVEKQLQSIQRSERASRTKMEEFRAILKGATKEGVPEADQREIERWKQQLGIDKL